MKLPSNKKFGFFFTAVFAISALYLFHKEKILISFIFCFLTFLSFLITQFKANMLLPFNKIWIKLGLLMGKIVSPIILGIIFFGIFLPIGILMKIINRDELQLKFKSKVSYWKIKNTDINQVSSFKNQF